MVILFAFSKWDHHIKKGKLYGIIQPTYGCSGKRNGRESWRKLIKNPLRSLIKAPRQNNSLSANSEGPPVKNTDFEQEA